MSTAMPGYVLSRHVPPMSEARSSTRKSSIPARRSAIAMPIPPIPAPITAISWSGSATQRLPELSARVDPELAVRAAQVRLHGLLGHEQGLGDLGVRHAVGGHGCNSALAGGERVGSRHPRPPRPPARRPQLLAGAFRERPGPARVGEVERTAQLIA